jgi:phage terminase large subunit GpA-like protein
MDAISDPRVDKVVIMSSAQVGKTEIINNTVGYYMAYDPAPMMVVQPTIGMGETYSKQRLAPMIRDTPALTGLISDPKSRNSDNTISEKSFPGGYVVISGANSAASLAGRPIRILLFDEVDRAPESAGTEGDPVALAEMRTATFVWNRKIILTSTPTVKDSSRIEQAYEESSKERWCLPCPGCGEYQPLEWRRLQFDTLEMACRECGELYGRREWLGGEGQWVAENHGNRVRGFHMSALTSPWTKWEDLVEEWEYANARAKFGDIERLKVFINTKLGETWEERGEKLDETGLMSRREEYYADIPDGVCALTIGVDTQDNRLCYTVMGWGAGKESWAIEYGELWGDPRVAGSVVWAQLDEVIRRRRTYSNGVPVPVVCTCIDMGGHAPDQVCTYAKARQGWNVWAVRGDHHGQGRLLVGSTFKSKVASATAFNLGVDTGKDEIMARLRVENHGPGYCHFPRGETQDYTGEYESVRGFDQRYFAGLTAEKKMLVINKTTGRRSYRWVNESRQENEPLDTLNYAGAALVISKVNLDSISSKAPWMRGAPSVYKPPPIRATGNRLASPAARQPLNAQIVNSYTQV